MPNYVPPEGRQDARIVLIGEAPGKQENARRRPFVGMSWEMRLRPWLEAVGIQRTDLYITNVHKYQPPHNKIEAIPKDELAQSVDALHDELAGLTDPWIIVPTGNVALKALIGQQGIGKWRGSVLPFVDRLGREIKVIPTIHPAATFRTPKWERRCRMDWKRIARESQRREIVHPVRERHINPTLDDLPYFLELARRSTMLSVDIETPRRVTTELVRTTKKGKPIFRKNRSARFIAMVGFGVSASESFAIPTTETYWGTTEAVETAWQYIETLCALPQPKALQNGMFDQFWLAWDRGIWFNNWRYDTMAMHHALEYDDDHSLAYLASIDTDEPYWKESGKDNDEEDDDPEFTGNFDEYQLYNGTDCCVTWELSDLYQFRLLNRNLMPFYFDHYMDLFDPLTELMLHGVKVNEARRKEYAEKFKQECAVIQRRVAAAVGYSLFARKTLSNDKVKKFLYEDMGVPKVFKTEKGERKVTTNEVALRQIKLKYPKNATLQLVIDDILRHRRVYQVGTFVAEGKTDADGRMRCQYNFTTKFNRLKSKKNPLGTGRNLQNLDREILDIFEPDEGIMLEVDGSQAEDRVTKVYAYNYNGDKSVLDRARSMPWENDEHKRAAALVFRTALATVTKDQRYLGKRTRHASHYGAHGKRLSEELLKEGYVFTPNECQAMIDSLIEADPYIAAYQLGTRREIIQNKEIANSWGRVFKHEFGRLDDEVYRNFYASRPQSDVGMWLNQCGLKPLYKFLRESGFRSRINMQVHDSLKVSIVDPAEALPIAVFLKGQLEVVRSYGGTDLSIPCEFKLGLNAAGEVEFKEFSTKEFRDAAYELFKKHDIETVV